MFSFNNIFTNTTIGPMVNETFGPIVNETFGLMVNFTNGSRNEEDNLESGGFPYPLLALIIPFGFIILFGLLICFLSNLSNYRRRQ